MIDWIEGEPDRNVVPHCGARFAQSLIRTGLADEHWLPLRPSVQDEGLRSLDGQQSLRLAESTHSRSGAVALTYVSA